MPRKGLEPSILTEYEPQSYVYTKFHHLGIFFCFLIQDGTNQRLASSNLPASGRPSSLFIPFHFIPIYRDT